MVLVLEAQEELASQCVKVEFQQAMEAPVHLHVTLLSVLRESYQAKQGSMLLSWARSSGRHAMRRSCSIFGTG